MAVVPRDQVPLRRVLHPIEVRTNQVACCARTNPDTSLAVRTRGGAGNVGAQAARINPIAPGIGRKQSDAKTITAGSGETVDGEAADDTVAGLDVETEGGRAKQA